MFSTEDKGILGATTQLKEFIDSFAPEKQFQVTNALAEGMLHYRQQFNAALASGDTASEIMKQLFKIVRRQLEESQKKKPVAFTCKAGCAHCCYVHVDMGSLEGETILEYCNKNNIDINEPYLRMQATEKDKPFYQTIHRRCTFLGEDNRCKIYEVRPIVCRKYFVNTAPELCDTYNNNQKNVGIYRNIDIEVLCSALIDETTGHLPDVLLKLKAKEHGNIATDGRQGADRTG